MEYIEIKEQIKQKLPVARDLGDSENLLELGLSSLTIMRLVNQWRKQGVKVSFGSLMENPTLLYLIYLVCWELVEHWYYRIRKKGQMHLIGADYLMNTK